MDVRKISNHSGGNGKRDPPVLIPNTEVKPLRAECTWLDTARETMAPPDTTLKRDFERSPFSVEGASAYNGASTLLLTSKPCSYVRIVRACMVFRRVAYLQPFSALATRERRWGRRGDVEAFSVLLRLRVKGHMPCFCLGVPKVRVGEAIARLASTPFSAVAGRERRWTAGEYRQHGVICGTKGCDNVVPKWHNSEA